MKQQFGQEKKNTTRRDLDRIGRYELIYPLGQGGMATVYVGQSTGLAGFEKLVAIKVIHPHLGKEREFVDMFLDEARIAAQILHPNVAAVHDVDEEDGLLYMAGELVRGQSLKALLKRSRAEGTELTEAMIAHIAAKVCAGLHAAHELTDAEDRPLNLVHRDVSPQNVLVSYAGFVKLIDFGVAHARGRLSHTEAGMIKGKMGYVSPEQLLSKTLDRRSDLFSVGVLLYEMVSGKHPFPGKTGMERLHRIARGQLVPPREVAPRLSPALERIILKALVKDRNRRYQTADEMAEDLSSFARTRDKAIGPPQLTKVMTYLFSADIAEQDRRLKGASAGGSAIGKQMQSSEGHAWTASGTRAAMPSQKRRWLKTTIAAAAAAAAIAVGMVAVAMLGDEEAGRNPTPEPARVSGPDVAAPELPAKAPESAAIEPDDKSVRLSFELSPPDALIVLDGSRVVAGLDEIMLPADGERHTITCRARGFRAQTVEITADKDRTVIFELKPAAKQPRKKTGRKPPVLVPNPY